MVWVTSSESVEADEVGVQVDLTSDESVRPERIEREGVSEHVNRAGLIGAAQEDDLAAGMERQIRLPRLREGRSWRGSIQGASPQQDPSDRADRGQRTVALFQQLTMDRRIAELSQGTRVLESLAGGENDLFDRGGHAVGWSVRARRVITPLDAVQSLPGSPGNPSLNGRTADMELTRDPSSAPSRPDGGND